MQYTAGYTTIPEAVQEACAEWVSIMFQLASRDPAIASLTLTGVSTTNYQQQMFTGKMPPPPVAMLLAPYRRYSIGTGQG